MNWESKQFFGSRVPVCHPDASRTPVGRAGKNDGADKIGENDGIDEIEKNDGVDQIAKNDPADEIIYVTDVYDLASAHRDTSHRDTSHSDMSHCDVPHILFWDTSAWRAGLSLQKRGITSMPEGTQP